MKHKIYTYEEGGRQQWMAEFYNEETLESHLWPTAYANITWRPTVAAGTARTYAPAICQCYDWASVRGHDLDARLDVSQPLTENEARDLCDYLAASTAGKKEWQMKQPTKNRRTTKNSLIKRLEGNKKNASPEQISKVTAIKRQYIVHQYLLWRLERRQLSQTSHVLSQNEEKKSKAALAIIEAAAARNVHSYSRRFPILSREQMIDINAIARPKSIANPLNGQYKQHLFFSLFRLFATTGLRPKEAASLTIENFNILHKDGVRRSFFPDSKTTNGANRALTIGDYAIAPLKEYLIHRDSLPDTKDKQQGVFFLTERGTRFRPGYMARLFRVFFGAINYKIEFAVTPYTLRRTHACMIADLLVAEGAYTPEQIDRIIAEIFGWSLQFARDIAPSTYMAAHIADHATQTQNKIHHQLEGLDP